MKTLTAQEIDRWVDGPHLRYENLISLVAQAKRVPELEAEVARLVDLYNGEVLTAAEVEGAQSEEIVALHRACELAWEVRQAANEVNVVGGEDANRLFDACSRLERALAAVGMPVEE